MLLFVHVFKLSHTVYVNNAFLLACGLNCVGFVMYICFKMPWDDLWVMKGGIKVELNK